MKRAAHSAFELPMSRRRNKNCRFKLDKSIVSISMQWISLKPIMARSFSSSQPSPPAPTTKILHVFIRNSKVSGDAVKSWLQNGPFRSRIRRKLLQRFDKCSGNSISCGQCRKKSRKTKQLPASTSQNKMSFNVDNADQWISPTDGTFLEVIVLTTPLQHNKHFFCIRGISHLFGWWSSIILRNFAVKSLIQSVQIKWIVYLEKPNQKSQVQVSMIAS